MESIVEKARNFAIEKHGSQKYGVFPYVYHLDEVYEVLLKFTNNLQVETDFLLTAAYLHDILEDTDTTEDDILTWGFSDALRVVKAVTNEDSKSETYEKTSKSVYATILKLADRIANVEACLKFNTSKGLKYKLEQKQFSKVLDCLATPHGIEERNVVVSMWGHLEELCKAFSTVVCDPDKRNHSDRANLGCYHEEQLKALINGRQKLIDKDRMDSREADEMLEEILKIVKSWHRVLRFETCIEALTSIGHSPSLIFRDVTGEFAISGDGVEHTPFEESSKFEGCWLMTSGSWKSSVRQALEHYVEGLSWYT